MPTIFTHAVVPLAAGLALGRTALPPRLVAAGVVAAMAPANMVPNPRRNSCAPEPVSAVCVKPLAELAAPLGRLRPITALAVAVMVWL